MISCSDVFLSTGSFIHEEEVVSNRSLNSKYFGFPLGKNKSNVGLFLHLKWPRCNVRLIIPNASTSRGPIDLKLYYSYLNEVQIQCWNSERSFWCLCSSPESFTFFQLVVLVSTAYIFPAVVLSSLVFQYQAAVSCKKKSSNKPTLHYLLGTKQQTQTVG